MLYGVDVKYSLAIFCVMTDCCSCVYLIVGGPLHHQEISLGISLGLLLGNGLSIMIVNDSS